MPGGDRTGPMGMGPMTGRAAGNCAGNPVPGFVSTPGSEGRGFGGGRGRGGRGRRNRFRADSMTGSQGAPTGMPVFAGSQPTATPQTGPDAAPGESEKQELDLLKRQAASLANTLDEIKKRIAGLETRSQEE